MSTTTTYTGVRIVDMPDLGAMNAASSVVGERAGSGRFSAAALKTWVQDTTTANVRNYGAVGNGVTDDTAAIQAAVNSGLPVVLPAGNYLISGEIGVNTCGQSIRGAGRLATILTVAGPSAGFGTGIFAVSNPTPGVDACQYFSDFTLSMAQPDTNMRASLNAYPPAFYLYQTTRVQFMNVRICGGMDGIFMFGNCGGFRAYGVDFACYGRNIYIDGNLDVTSFTDCEVWPFATRGIMTANQQKIFYDANCYGILSLRNDYLDWKGGLFLCGRAAVFQNQPSGSWPGPTYGHFSGTGFDTFGGLEVAAGNILTSDCTFSVGGDPTQAKNAVTHTGGSVTVRGAKFFVGTNPINNGSLIYSLTPAGVAGLTVSECNFETGLTDVRAVYVGAGNPYLSAVITGNQFDKFGSGTYTLAIVELDGGNGVVANNVMLNPTGGALSPIPWLGIGAGAGPYMVRGNMVNSWATAVVSNSVPSGSLITVPAVVGDAMPEIIVTGNTTINSMTYSPYIGVQPAYGGLTVTLVFSATITINNGTVGTAGQFILNGRTNFVANANSSLTVQLTTQGNWQEIGRCA